MPDYHLHTKISFDGIDTAEEIAIAAHRMGLKEICFTDHWDCHWSPTVPPNRFSLEEYGHTYDSLA